MKQHHCIYVMLSGAILGVSPDINCIENLQSTILFRTRRTRTKLPSGVQPGIFGVGMKPSVARQRARVTIGVRGLEFFFLVNGLKIVHLRAIFCHKNLNFFVNPESYQEALGHAPQQNVKIGLKLCISKPFFVIKTLNFCVNPESCQGVRMYAPQKFLKN